MSSGDPAPQLRQPSNAAIYLHLVFSTKNRTPYLADRGLRREVHAYLSRACERFGSPSLIVGGVEDHVYILCFMSRTRAIADVVRDLKTESSVWIRTKGGDLRGYEWQKGYGAFSISPSHVDRVREYIEDQARHHQQESFQDEYRRLLKKYGADLDERYVWD